MTTEETTSSHVQHPLGSGCQGQLKRMKLRAYEVGQIVDAVEEQRTHQPDRESKRKKLIRPEEQLPFEPLPAVWQLRVGEFRVRIRAVRRKPPHKTTKEIL